MAVNKLDPKIIFASEAPAQDTPAVFNNRTLGWGESRKNGGRPTIKQMNALQQDTELKILWLNENAVTPFDATVDYPVNSVTIKDGQFKIFNGASWNLFLDKSSVGLNNVDNTSDLDKPISTAVKVKLDYIDNNGAALPYKEGIAYEENVVVVKDGVLQQWKGGEWEVVSEQELKKYLLAAGITEAELNSDYNYLMERLAQIAVDKGWDASFVVDGDKTQKQINDNQARLNFSTIDNLANSTISNGGVGTLWAAGAAIFQELAPSATNQSLTTASGVKLAYITPYLKTQVDGDAKTVLDIAHYSRQGSSPVTSPNAVSIHDYTDAPRSVQIDKVGGSATDYVLGLRRANNATRRPDKTSEYIGGAGFLRCSYDRFTDGVKSEVLAFYIGPNANFGWSSDPASFVTAKPSNGTYAFTYSATVEEQYIASFGSASGQVLNIQDAISGTRTDIIAPANQTSGIRIEATGGGIDIAPKSGSPITVRGNINSTNGTDLTITAVGSTLNINATNGIKSLAPHRFSLHNVGTLPNAANFPNHMILVTNGDAGQPCLAVSNGTSWLRIPLGAAVSAT